MKKNKLSAMLASVALFGFLLSGCDMNLPEFKAVGVESIELNDAQLAAGVKLEAEKTMNISLKVAIIPGNATDRAESYSSDNTSIAVVDQRGDLTGVSPGNTKINITVGGKTVSFDLTVTPKVIIPATALSLSSATYDVFLGMTFNLVPEVVLTPDDANDGLVFVSGDENIMTVSESGVITGVAMGTTSVTVSSKGNPALTATATVNVSVFSGWYPRTTWSMVISQQLPNITDCGQGIDSAIDGSTTTNLALVKPGKNQGGVSLTASEAVWFVIDMKQSQVINSFRITHRSGSFAHLRWYGFDYIYGSNDTTGDESSRQYTEIANNMILPATVSDSGVTSHEMRFTNTVAYRYIKFYAASTACFPQNTNNTVQMQEIELGLLD